VAADPAERKLAAILSADVVGYSRLMAEDEAGTVRTLTDYREQIAVLVRQHRGRVVDSTGDNLLADFPTATDAVECAVEIQRVLSARNAALAAERKMEFRIGVHLGEVRVEGDRIYGDGVNIAARLEGLAEAGGICVSGTVHEQIQRKLEFGYDDLGRQDLKNIPDPVQAYRILLESEAGIPLESLPGMDELTVPGFGGRPAIAVLPFDNLSGDPEQEYFVDGIVEELITGLSRWRRFPVIARNSSFAYKGKPVDIKRVSAELGVRYAVEGSVRKAGDRVRITAQLIDATTGAHVWAERYDRELTDIFALQDEITEAIAAAMYPELQRHEWKRAAQREPEDLDAYELVMRGWWHIQQYNKNDNVAARLILQRAAEWNPKSSSAFVGLAWAHYLAVVFQWSDSADQSIAEANKAARRSVELNAANPAAHIVLGQAYSLAGQPQEELAALQRAVELNPSDFFGYASLADCLAGQGRAEEAIGHLEKAMRLSPRDPMKWYFFHVLGKVHLAAGRYEESIEWQKRCVGANPRFPASLGFLAAGYAHLGRMNEARTTLEELLRRMPGLSVSAMERWHVSAAPDFVERYRDGLRKAGLKE
jgi:adenylate cyclase